MSSIAIPAVHCAKIISQFLSDKSKKEGLLVGALKEELITETTDSVDHRISSRQSYVLHGILPTPLSTDKCLLNDQTDKPSTSNRIVGWYRCRYSNLTSVSLKDREVHRRLSECYCDPLVFMLFVFVPNETELKLYILFNIINQRDAVVQYKVPSETVNLVDTNQTYYFQPNKGIVNFDSEAIQSVIPSELSNQHVKKTVTESADRLFESSISRLAALHEETARRRAAISQLQAEIVELTDEPVTASSEDNESVSLSVTKACAKGDEKEDCQQTEVSVPPCDEKAVPRVSCV